jgi:DNA repair ATPase RecN
MQSFASTHKKKKSNFSSIIGSKFDLGHLNKSAITHEDLREVDPYHQLLMKSESILDQYQKKYEALEKENKRYKRRYQ